MKRYVIAGGTGLIGSALASALAERGDEVVVLSRSDRSSKGNVRYRTWDGKSLGAWAEEICGAEAVINLAGDSVMQSWRGDGYKKVRNSRLEPTQILGKAIDSCEVSPPAYWLNGSAIGYYGDRGETVLEEASGSGDPSEPLVNLCLEWEAAATSSTGLPIGLCRTGIVLSKKGGSLGPMVTAAKSWVAAGHLGSGEQYLPWIHIDDVIGIMLMALDQRWSGPINVTAPEPAKNRDFAATLRQLVGRPWAPPAPAFVVSTLSKVTGMPLDQALTSARVVPRRALEAGYLFRFPRLKEALQAEI